jgi:hypothetical protein
MASAALLFYTWPNSSAFAVLQLAKHDQEHTAMHCNCFAGAHLLL